jgi:hypothetical protein
MLPYFSCLAYNSLKRVILVGETEVLRQTDVKTEGFGADPKLGLVAGGVLRIPLTRDIGVQPEILISQKGFRGSGSLLGSPYDFSRTSTFIDIPLQLALRPTEFFSLLVGPQYSYLINQKDVFTNSFASFSQEQVFKTDNIRKNMLGFVLGMDVMFNHFVVGGRIGWDMRNNKGDGSSSTPTYRNTWFQGTVGYAFFRE